VEQAFAASSAAPARLEADLTALDAKVRKLAESVTSVMA